MKPAIVFIGFMGAGKSRALKTLGGSFDSTIDVDTVISDRVGMEVRDFFDAHGEEEFRAVEEEVVTALLAEADGSAIALGGGSILSERIRAALAGHLVVWLDIGADAAWSRVSHTRRPLVASGREAFDALLREREPLYLSIADAVLPAGDPEMVINALPAIQALTELPAGTKLLWAASDSAEYPIFVGPGLLEAGWWPLASRRFVVSDENVMPLYAEKLRPLAGQAAIAPGEEAKTMVEATGVLEALAEAGLTREDHVVALGGGVVGDLAGLCAHLYQRGVEVVQVPTTLVAQVDSAYGGKTGVDLPQGKNYAGAYQLPAAVLVDTACLETLPLAELRAGFVEVLKTGLLAGGALWERVLTIEGLDAVELADVVFSCARFKCEVVAADERDGGLRHMLNLGHTVGHAIEAATGYSRYRHGEAVGLGLLAALRLSDAAELRDQVKAILGHHGLPLRLDPPVDVDAIIDALQRDKKRTAAGVGFVLLAEPGRPRVGQLVDPARVRAAVEELIA